MMIFPVGVGILGFIFVAYLSAKVLANEPGNARMQELSGYIYEGAMAFLAREYRAIAVFAVLITILLGFGIDRRDLFARRRAHWHAYRHPGKCPNCAGRH
jgi:K(+)-stimulated pyrophosphate-energized sodium pump